jgi:hypothetical protein
MGMMSNSEVGEVRTIAAGGFRIVKGTERIEVVRDKQAFDSSTRKKRLAIFLSGIVASSLMLIGQFIRIDIAHPVPIAWATHIFPWVSPGCFLPLIIALGVLYSGAVNLTCTRDEVQATWIRFGKVKRILTFLAGGKLVKCLPGLKCVEAQLILNELERMGFDVVRDPEMPTMVQVEQSRRKR